MARTALSSSQLEDFRDALCEHAMRLFAEHGYEGVTMRALATELGCSPMTPYRYFDNKAAIFDAVASVAANLFADALEDSIADVSGPRARLRAIARAYAGFALEHPHAYRIMFEVDRCERPAPNDADDLRSWNVMHRAVEAAVAADVLEGDPDVVAHLLWSGMHGIVALHLSGKLQLGREVAELVDAFIDRELGNARGAVRPLPAR